MTRTEIEAEVLTLTNRSDLTAEIASMVTAATLRMHQSDFYARDLAEDVLDLGSEGYTFSFLVSSFPRFRALSYLRKYDAVADSAGILLSKLDPLNLMDSYGIEKNDVFYLAGNSIVLRSSSSVRYLLAGWYQLPATDPVSYSSWIADLVPHAIIFDACSLIFQMIGQQDQSRKFDALVAEQLVMVKTHGLMGVGY